MQGCKLLLPFSVHVDRDKMWYFDLCIPISLFNYVLHSVLAPYSQYIHGIINVTCACIFHSIDAVEMRFGKGTWV